MRKTEESTDPYIRDLPTRKLTSILQGGNLFLFIKGKHFHNSLSKQCIFRQSLPKCTHPKTSRGCIHSAGPERLPCARHCAARWRQKDKYSVPVCKELPGWRTGSAAGGGPSGNNHQQNPGAVQKQKASLFLCRPMTK